ncbi:MAG: hypothetical protein NZ811_02075 [Gammaproteobacteria bacterium]|nr:hypothetical protein [Gammaproteobacteria bacterium]
MTKFLLALLLSLNVLAIDDFDLYRYGADDKIEVGRAGFVLKLVFYDTFEELQVAFKKSAPTAEGEVRGFTYVSEHSDVCTVHIVKTNVWDDREALTILGHEVYHCTYANHKTVVTEKEVEEAPPVDPLDELDKKLELDMLKEDCANNTEFDFIAGCKELI